MVSSLKRGYCFAYHHHVKHIANLPHQQDLLFCPSETRTSTVVALCTSRIDDSKRISHWQVHTHWHVPQVLWRQHWPKCFHLEFIAIKFQPTRMLCQNSHEICKRVELWLMTGFSSWNVKTEANLWIQVLGQLHNFVWSNEGLLSLPHGDGIRQPVYEFLGPLLLHPRCCSKLALKDQVFRRWLLEYPSAQQQLNQLYRRRSRWQKGIRHRSK